MARKKADADAPTGTDRAELIGVVTRGETVYALVVMSGESAADALGLDVDAAAPARVLTAVERDIAKLPDDLAESALAASAVAMALEIEHPYNSATSKSMCQARLMDALRELRALAPEEEAMDGIDQLAAKRAERLAAGGAAT